MDESIWAVQPTHQAKYPRLGQFEFQRSGSTMAGTLGNSKAARIKTARAAEANAAAVLAGGGSNALGEDGKPIYQQNPVNPKKSKKNRK